MIARMERSENAISGSARGASGFRKPRLTMSGTGALPASTRSRRAERAAEDGGARRELHLARNADLKPKDRLLVGDLLPPQRNP